MLLVSRLLTVHTQSLVSTDNRSEVNEMVKLLSMFVKVCVSMLVVRSFLGRGRISFKFILCVCTENSNASQIFIKLFMIYVLKFIESTTSKFNMYVCLKSFYAKGLYRRNDPSVIKSSTLDNDGSPIICGVCIGQ